MDIFGLNIRQTVTYNSRFIKSLIVLIATRLKQYASQVHNIIQGDISWRSFDEFNYKKHHEQLIFILIVVVGRLLETQCSLKFHNYQCLKNNTVYKLFNRSIYFQRVNNNFVDGRNGGFVGANRLQEKNMPSFNLSLSQNIKISEEVCSGAELCSPVREKYHTSHVNQSEFFLQTHDIKINRFYGKTFYLIIRKIYNKYQRSSNMVGICGVFPQILTFLNMQLLTQLTLTQLIYWLCNQAYFSNLFIYSYLVYSTGTYIIYKLANPINMNQEKLYIRRFSSFLQQTNSSYQSRQCPFGIFLQLRSNNQTIQFCYNTNYENKQAALYKRHRFTNSTETKFLFFINSLSANLNNCLQYLIYNYLCEQNNNDTYKIFIIQLINIIYPLLWVLQSLLIWGKLINRNSQGSYCVKKNCLTYLLEIKLCKSQFYVFAYWRNNLQNQLKQQLTRSPTDAVVQQVFITQDYEFNKIQFNKAHRKIFEMFMHQSCEYTFMLIKFKTFRDLICIFGLKLRSFKKFKQFLFLTSERFLIPFTYKQYNKDLYILIILPINIICIFACFVSVLNTSMGNFGTGYYSIELNKKCCTNIKLYKIGSLNSKLMFVVFCTFQHLIFGGIYWNLTMDNTIIMIQNQLIKSQIPIII
ncbi:hypothetical protein pb186bvf_005468 [Paramecium bursaria]